MTKQNDSLFLLEVLIDKIVFLKSPCFSDKDFKTCVNIECAGVEPLEICDDESGTCIAKSNGPFIKSFNSGKSCLFSLSENEIATAMTKFPINISVYKSLPCGCLPTKIIMGECTIDMTKEFVEARKTFLEDPTNVGYQALKDSFKIVGPDYSETGDIVMFLRISCFGKLIITKFQGPGAPLNLETGKKTEIVDRSCAPNKAFQSMQDPCVCGGTRGLSMGGGSSSAPPCTASGRSGVCPPAKDPYNSMPCEDPDDVCFCSGPKPVAKQQMICRNTDKYCLHVPKGSRALHSPYQKNTDSQMKAMRQSSRTCCDFRHSKLDAPKDFSFYRLLSVSSYSAPNTISTKMSKRSTASFSTAKETYIPIMKSDYKGIFGSKEISVYMTIPDKYSKFRQSLGTQATASVNKCLQVYEKWRKPSLSTNSDYCSTCTMSTMPCAYNKKYIPEKIFTPEIYFFGRKKDDKKKGMGSKASNTSLAQKSQATSTGTKSDVKKIGSKSIIQTGPQKPHVSIAKSKSQISSKPVSGTSKCVTIKDDKTQKPCPSLGVSKGDMMITVSHIKIGPKETCPVHGSEPCRGPKCVLASSGEEQGPVKVTSANNPRRGVFEIVIRKLTGAPLARNELMLEWTPPPTRPTPCNMPCPLSPSYCRYSKCKLILCRPPSCKPKCAKNVPCGQIRCGSLSCRRCCKASCCQYPCGKCSTCSPRKPCCAPSPCGNPCRPPCARPQCTSPCKSSPCVRPCPVGRKRNRKCRSQPRIRSHRKRISPCHNKLKSCPVVRCRSVPGPCSACCSPPLLCLPRKCCSVLPCKPPKRTFSNCSSCCG